MEFVDVDGAPTPTRIPSDRTWPDTPATPLRVYVGAADSDAIPAAVLEHSIRAHASRPIEFSLMARPMPLPRDKANRPVTRFSFKRFLIPELAGYRGRALYMDSDMQVFGDLVELWRIPFGPHRVLCSVQSETPERWRNDKSNFHTGRHFAVMLLDCSRLDWDAAEIVRGLDERRYTYKELMTDLCVVPSDEIGETLPVAWNSLEKYEPGVTKNLHYTVIRTQPWRYPGNPLEPIWWRGYRAAIAAGKIDFELVADAVRRRWCRPELLDEFEGGREARARLGFKLRAATTRSARAVRRAFLGREY